MPISIFDIAADGKAHAPVGPLADGSYRWWHFDLADPDLPSWLDTEVPAIPAAALTAPETRPRCDVHADGLILNLRGINLNADGPADQMVAVRMWVTAQMVVTVRVRRVFALHDLRQDAEAGHAPGSPIGFVTSLAGRLTHRVQDQVFELGDCVDLLEDTIRDPDITTAPDMVDHQRMAIRLRRYLGPQRDALVKFTTVDSPLISASQRASLAEQANLAKLAVEELDSLTRRLDAVQMHHSAEHELRQSHNSYVLSIVAAVFLPLGFLTGLFGVNVAGVPGVQTPWAFAALCGGLGLLTLVALLGLRRLKWI